MKQLKNTLFAKISLLFLLLLIGFCLAVVGFTVREFGAFLEELEQRLNLDLASQLVNELGPQLATDLHSVTAIDAVRRLQSFNPALDIYVIGEDGTVAASYNSETELLRSEIDVTPIRKFLSDKPMLPILAADPAKASGEKVFSAARLTLPGDRKGYLFIILRGQPLETAATMLQNSYIVRGIGFAMAGTLLLVLVVGFLLFSVLTRRFRRLIDTVRSYGDGNYERRVLIDSDDEIASLGRAINEMAGTIQAQVEALRRTDEDRRTLVANVSHDFRTPLTSLRCYVERLATSWERIDPDERHASFEAVLRNTRQLESLASQLALLSQLDTDGGSAQMECFALNELMQDVTLSFALVAKTKSVQLNAHFSAPQKVWSDISMIDRVLSNLIDNAVKSTERGGFVNVRSELTPDGMLVTVADTGVGIDSDELALVTQRFYRTKRSARTHPTGTGLGLAIAKEILEVTGSNLTISSTPGKGTEASFTLQLCDD